MKNKISKMSTWVFTLYVGGIKYEYEVQAQTEEEAELKAIAHFEEDTHATIGEELHD